MVFSPKRLIPLHVLLLSLRSSALIINGLSFWHWPDSDTLRPMPGDTAAMTVEAEESDPIRVDVMLFDIDRGNITTGLSSLKVSAHTRIGFQIPQVPSGNFWIRFVSSQNGVFVTQTPMFHIYPPGSTQVAVPPPTVTPSIPSSVTQISPTIASTSPSSTPSNNSSTTSSNTHTIIVATLGGVVLFLVLLIFVVGFLQRWIKTSHHLNHLEKPSSPLWSLSSLAPKGSAKAYSAVSRAEALQKEREQLDKETWIIQGTAGSLTRSLQRA
ncbi:hypothetical protein D9756_010579 [Leucocoprinus leucothites]|uniref:Uncharacterized protein n=1 Tax=Leucocoprinus leucothites TaxID=201217 RepID=A0A8H5CT20_9AGAR|nr:hypothetical protein D9756_010579 [Leucoagaricus leucothites]